MAHANKHLLFCLLLALLAVFSSGQTVSVDSIHTIYFDNFRKIFGNDSEISLNDLEIHFKKHSMTWLKSDGAKECFHNKSVLDKDCLLKQCLSPEDVFSLLGFNSSKNVTDKELYTLSLILQHLKENNGCEDVPQKYHQPGHPVVVSIESWGYGILCTTVINICSLAGVIALPFIRRSIYKKLLTYMVGLAVGTLAGSSLLFLIPAALQLTDQELNEHNYMWKCLVIISGIYTFFLIERILKMILEYKEKRDEKRNDDAAVDFSTFHQAPPLSEYKKVDDLPHIAHCNNDASYIAICDKVSICEKGDTSSLQSKDSAESNNLETHYSNEIANGKLMISENKCNSDSSHHHRHHHHSGKVARVAWMIIFGDGIHNFIDGISIGAAFTDSTLAGVSVAVATLCEELPHELGDFAVLLNAGLSVKRAVIYNFLSACMCYLGLFTGILLGENAAVHNWVFAFAGGMFLYISLVDMMPEMNSAGESEEIQAVMGRGMTFLLQNLGLLSGLGIMFLMATFGGHLEDSIKGGS